MQIHTISRSVSGLFSEAQLILCERQHELRELIHSPFSKAAIVKQAKQKGEQFGDQKREILQKALIRQYEGIEMGEGTKNNIALLSEQNTFTVTTGHQLSLLTGPLYFVIKILHVIRQTELLNAEFPEYRFVPVYWMASEDHDAEEVQSMHLFQSTLQHDYQQTGAVGHFRLNEFEAFKSQVLEFFGADKRHEIENLLKAYSGENLASATRSLVNFLFGHYGLVIIDGDDTALKRSFIPVIEKELFQGFAEKEVLRANEQLEKIDIAPQVFARPINLFYLTEHTRERIEKDGDTWLAGTTKRWSHEELLDEVERHPERFSPNVVLRPVYQEVILPNVCYIGGAGEIAYWTQLKGVFDASGILFPLIQVRNSVIWIDRTVAKKRQQLNLSIDDLFESSDVLKKRYVVENAGEDLDFSEVETTLELLNSQLIAKITGVDGQLVNYANAEVSRLEKQLESVKSKLVKTVKARNEQAMAGFDTIKERLFPGGGLQERKYNLLHFCADGEVSSKIELLKKSLQPFSSELILLEDVDGQQ